MKERRLGKGLESLLGPAPEVQPKGGDVLQVPLDQVVPNPFQPRKVFSTEEMQELVRSVRELGILQPVLVRRRGERYELVAGERRWRAAKEVGLSALPALVKDFDDAQMLEVALIENTQRANLNPIERALAYRELMMRFQLSQDQAAEKLGLDRSTVANFLRLLELSPDLQDCVSRETIGMSHARALLAIRDPIERLRVGKRIEREGLSVRQVEALARERKATKPTSTPAPDSHVADLEERMREKLGSKVRIESHGARGVISIEYYSLEHFDQILAKLGI